MEIFGFVEMFGGYTARGGGEEQCVCQQPGKSEMLVLEFYCRVKESENAG